MASATVPASQHRVSLNDPVAQVAGNIALSAGFGTTATVTAVTGNDENMSFLITSSGTGQGANPTVTITWQVPFLNTPVVVVSRDGLSQPTIPFTVTVASLSKTSCQLVFRGTPVAAETYTVFLITSDV